MTEPVRRLRIGIDARSLEGDLTGVGRYVKSLLRRWKDASPYTFVLYSTGASSTPRVEAAPAGADLEPRSFTAAHPLVWEHVALPRALRRDRIDVLLAPAYSTPLLWRGKSVVAMHDVSFFARPEEFRGVYGARLRFFARRAAATASALLACSEFTRDEIGRVLGRKAAAKTRVVPLGPDDDRKTAEDRGAARAALGVGAADPLVLTVGSIFPRRNVGPLIEGFAALRSRIPNARLLIVGENRSNGLVDPAAVARTLGVADAVTLTGFVDDERVALAYAAADVAVFLSDYEGFGLPALEALSRGVPTIIGEGKAQAELFSEGALVVNAHSRTAVASALYEALVRDAPRARLRDNGHRVARRFDWERAATETLHVLVAAALGRSTPDGSTPEGSTSARSTLERSMPDQT
jgi:alpha-1,3-rhamnosyl/mannosyltransferase